MQTLGRTISVKGEVRTSDDLTVEGRVEGFIHCEGRTVVLGPTSEVTGEILADDITIFGRCAGQLIATEVVDVRAEADVSGQVMTRRFILDEAARFHGRVAPQHLEAALSVARFQQRKRQARIG